MTWTMEGLMQDVASAWAPANLPYTIAFWVIVGVVAGLSLRRRKGERQK